MARKARGPYRKADLERQDSKMAKDALVRRRKKSKSKKFGGASK
jgi:hypothetical protein